MAKRHSHIAPPITCQIDGKQYIAVASGIGCAYNNFSGEINLKNINPGGSIWVLELGDGGNTSTISADTIQPPVIEVAKAPVDDKSKWSDAVKHGAELYEQTCSHCHGVEIKTSGTTFDLRTFPKGEKDRFITAVTEGKGSMPAWGDKLTSEEISDIYKYVIH